MRLTFLVFLLLLFMSAVPCSAAVQNPCVVIETNLGTMVVELYPQAAPITVDNFLFYVNSGFYDKLLFHRVIPDFMIQGGGYYLNGYNISRKTATAAPITNESYNGLRNLRGTIAMARTNLPHSATSEFFINHVDNSFLDKANAQDGYGYCVFGKVVCGMDVVDAIAQVPTVYVSSGLANFPVDPPVIIYHAGPIGQLSNNSDVTHDGIISFADFADFASSWLSNDCDPANTFCGATDLDYDGSVDIIDLDLFIRHWDRQVGYEPAFSDVLPDGSIDFNDLAGLVGRWLDSGCALANGYCSGADVNRDGTVDLADAAYFSGNWLLDY